MQPDSAAGRLRLQHHNGGMPLLACCLFGGRRFCYFSSVTLLFEEAKSFETTYTLSLFLTPKIRFPSKAKHHDVPILSSSDPSPTPSIKNKTMRAVTATLLLLLSDKGSAFFVTRPSSVNTKLWATADVEQTQRTTSAAVDPL